MNVMTAAVKKLVNTNTADEVERLEWNVRAYAEKISEQGTEQASATRELAAAERHGEQDKAEAAAARIAAANVKIEQLRIRAKANEEALAEARIQLATEQKAERIAEAKTAIERAAKAADSAGHDAVVEMLALSKAFSAYSKAADAERAARNALARESDDAFAPNVGLRGTSILERQALVQAKTFSTIQVSIPASR